MWHLFWRCSCCSHKVHLACLQHHLDRKDLVVSAGILNIYCVQRRGNLCSLCKLHTFTRHTPVWVGVPFTLCYLHCSQKRLPNEVPSAAVWPGESVSCILQGSTAAREQGQVDCGGPAVLWREVFVNRAVQQSLGQGTTHCPRQSAIFCYLSYVFIITMTCPKILAEEDAQAAHHTHGLCQQDGNHRLGVLCCRTLMLSQRCHMSGACALGKRQHRPQSLSCSCKLLCVQLPADGLQCCQALVPTMHALQCCVNCKRALGQSM